MGLAERTEENWAGCDVRRTGEGTEAVICLSTGADGMETMREARGLALGINAGADDLCVFGGDALIIGGIIGIDIEPEALPDIGAVCIVIGMRSVLVLVGAARGGCIVITIVVGGAPTGDCCRTGDCDRCLALSIAVCGLFWKFDGSTKEPAVLDRTMPWGSVTMLHPGLATPPCTVHKVVFESEGFKPFKDCNEAAVFKPASGIATNDDGGKVELLGNL